MSEDATRRPSPRAIDRLTSDVGDEVSDLRSRLHEALAEAGRLQAAGRHDLAVAVLEEQRDVLADVHRRLSDRLADAAVEREAERVVGAASADLPTIPAAAETHVGHAPTTPADATVRPRDRAPRDGSVLRLLASAAAAAVGVVLLLVPEVGGGMLTVAGWSPPGATTGDADVDGDVVAPGATTTDLRRGLRRRGEVSPATAEDETVRDLAIPENHDLGATATHDDPVRDGRDTTSDDPALAADLPLLESLLEGLAAGELPDGADWADGGRHDGDTPPPGLDEAEREESGAREEGQQSAGGPSDLDVPSSDDEQGSAER